MLKNRTSAILSMALVFVSGALLGGLGYRAYNTSSASAFRRPSPAEWRKHNLAEMRTRLKLDDQQYGQLEQIFDRFDEENRPVMNQRHQEDLAFPGSMVDKIKRSIGDDHAKLGLSEQQATQVNQEVDRVNEQFHQLMMKRHTEDVALQNSLVARINPMLQADQRVLYQQLRDERQKEWERRQKEGPKQGGRGPDGPPPPPPGGKK